MFTRTSSFVGAAVSELIVAAIAIILQGTAVFIAWATAGFTILAWRLGIIFMARRSVRLGRSVSAGWMAVGSIVWAIELGCGALICNMSGVPALQLLSVACVVSTVSGLSARNSSTPRLAVTQLAIGIGFTSLGAALAPELWIKVLLLQAPFVVIGLGSVCWRSGRDLVSMLDAQQKNAELARRDMLTGLSNRVRVNEELQALLVDAPPDSIFALIWIDLDGFKAINDTLGHAAGDVVLVETGRRLLEVCMPVEGRAARSVARLGGDEFLIILPQGERDEALRLAEALAASIRIPHILRNAPDVRLDASIGISLFPEHGDNADALLAAADRALYAVKASGRARVLVYDPLLHAGEDDLIQFRSELAKALGEGENQLQLYYQPIVRLSDGKVTDREALVRWNHPKRGLVSPGSFIPMAEASGLIVPLGEWVLRQACADAATWADNVKVAVNVSPFQLRSERLTSVVVQALDQAGLSPARLAIEITETAMLGQEGTTSHTMRQLRELGIEVVLDDFGTGFSSLSNLCSFVFDRIKIDGSFVKEALHRRDCAAVIHATVELARQLGIPTTAECVETPEQLEFVRACGCSEVQGYLLGRPEPAPGMFTQMASLPANLRMAPPVLVPVAIAH
ncbi:bifunctional diguanylate cyclase/phosphodiesterase [Lichenicola cladoniae]|uniref:Bifunctional diguanylate cyclase/phosphodiesterase n=1 Tax=Lichenicola cladoniae TaxID=1484109 RepID=A0A6M8HUT9_9PROT|nr:bifunctional diguanylate cyclase/phosphodiesterase [Lichenicola cladoniae]NPD66149.1 bifunctional diguanylate cyclase/phosphodiesterase [Acetobacteraceae bacterium]QKE92016.1 bifunctional diguanylate cyclase/phosphodiesterase [Lichenicola cladoniae]